MSWLGLNWYSYTGLAVGQNAPEASGVYAIANGSTWIYIGETNNIKRRLMEHLNGDNPCILIRSPDRFSFEFHGGLARVSRQNELILELRPACNQIFG
jgi:GIY-YIG catalytic domain